MAHIRERHLKTLVLQALKMSPLVGILGHRQVGKTTLMSQLCSDYRSLDDQEELQSALTSPKSYLSKIKGRPSGIDETQLAPPLFPALKERVRINPKPNQIIMSGSVRFTSRKAIRESLTGRILNFELLPFSIAELEKRESDQRIRKALFAKSFLRDHPFSLKSSNKELKERQKNINLYLESGGLPGICFIRETTLRNNKIQEQLLTILDRDLRLVTPTSLSFREILNFVQTLARLEGKVLQHSEIKSLTGISPVTQKKLLYALEALFIIRLVPLMGGRRGYTIYFEDQGESRFLSQNSAPLINQYESFLIRQARIQWAYELGSNPNFFQYLTRGGARIPFAISEENQTLGLIVFEGTQPDRSSLSSASSFLSKFNNSKVLLIATDHAVQSKAIDSRTLIVSLAECLT